MLVWMHIALSTSVCPVPAPATGLLRRWAALRADHGLTLATDARLPLAVQRELLAELQGDGIAACRQVTHPLLQTNGRPVASALSTDRDEREAAGQAMLETLQLAEAHRVDRVVLLPWSLPLHLPIPALARLFARDETLPLALLHDERRDRACAALDGLKLALDGLAARADTQGVQIILAAPAVWPHQLPDPDEIAELQRVFAGAPLGLAHHTDWQHAAQILRGTPADQPQTPQPAVIGLADACGLRLSLPLGTGQADWRVALEGQEPAHDSLPVVLSFDEQTTAAELRQALSLIG